MPGTVQLSSSDGSAVLPSNYTFTGGDAGVKTFSAALRTAGTHSITATDAGNGSINGTQSGILVRPAAAVSLSVSGYPSPTIAGVSHSFTMTARDAFILLGMTAIGDTAALQQVIDARAFDSAQVVYNMLNPSPPRHCRRTIRHRITDDCLIDPGGRRWCRRHPRARWRRPVGLGRAPSDRGAGAGADWFGVRYDTDVDRARHLIPLVEEGFALSLTEAATRFALSHPAMGTILVGMATPQQFEDALAAVEKGPLPQAALDRLSALRQAFSGEPR